jgi:hypothetical protein
MPAAERIMASTGMAKQMPWAPARMADVDADQLAVNVQQRATGVAGVDAGVGLDEGLVGHLLVEGDVAVDGADDADGDGVLVAVGVADGDDRLADLHVAGGAQGHGGQRPAGVTLSRARSASWSRASTRAVWVAPSDRRTRISWTSSMTCWLVTM